MSESRKIVEIPDPNDSWAKVEIYRWQHGELPPHDEKLEKPFDECLGLIGMANAIEVGNPKNFPTPENVASVLRYAAKRIAAITNS